jgi:KaiC/GvpD/RAD55 family RecA-like ATPase
MELQAIDFVKAKESVFATIGRPKPNFEERDIEATYDYTDEHGNVLYQVVRKVGKNFRQRRPWNGRWVWGLGDYHPVPFMLPALVSASSGPILIAEGERDCQNLARKGVVATCNNGGAGNFKPEIAHWFAGRAVAILPDNDEPGRKHAKQVAAILQPVALSVKILEIPNLPEKGDVSDFLQRGGTVAQLMEIYENAQEWTPEWDFATDIPHENDRYLRTLPQFVKEIGGLEQFWNLPAMEGIPTPWYSLNFKLGGGFRAGEVYIIGANTGQGKTSLALQFITHALRQRRGVLLFSMEMGHKDVFQRIVATDAGVDLSDFRQHQRAKQDTILFRQMRQSLAQATNEFLPYALNVSTKTRVTPEFLMKESERLKKRSRIDLIVIDHMQLMGTTGNVRGDYEKFTAISRAVKETAVEINTPLLLVSQTSRNNSHDKRTELETSDLRGSGALEEDAAGIMLLYDDKEDRQRALLQQTYDTGPVKTWLKLAKNRFGAAGCYMPLQHYKTFTRFEYEESK